LGSCRQGSGFLTVLMFSVLSLTARALPQGVTDDALHGLKWRLIGPFAGGRVEAVTGFTNNPNRYLMGAVAGGVWETTNRGQSWHSIFDHERIASIGAIAVAPSDPNVIYVGTGEPCLRGDSSYGDGVYRSTDGGKTWTHVGLPDTRHIARIVVDPSDPDIALVAAVGHAYGPNAERGIFRTADGGKTWQKTLFVDENTGASDLSMDTHNRRILFAGMWQVRRTPWSLVSGGAGSGIYRSTDGGLTWKRVTGEGLPTGVMGRVGVVVSPADPYRVYALIEAEAGGLYRSNDGGETWARINGSYDLRGRPWYYTHVFADPNNADVVYAFNFAAYRSIDGGKTFQTFSTPHGDYHALWIDPNDSTRMIIGNDGGGTVSTDNARSWTAEDNQPTAQFYHVAADNRFHYYLYGSQQDRGTVAIASQTDHGTIDRSDWYSVAGGESGFVIPSPNDPDFVYAGSLYSTFTRYDVRTGQTTNISPWPSSLLNEPAENAKYRLGWTPPMLLSPHDPNVMYLGAQLVLKTNDEGKTWTEISPDLTRNDKSKQKSSGGPITQDNTTVEYIDQVASLALSPNTSGVIWAGTDDGIVQLTRDEGKTWANVTPKSIPEWSMISVVEPSPHEAASAYIAVDAHRLDDFHPYLFKTFDYGKSWKSIVNGIPEGTYVHVIREDPAKKGVLFAGTELGIFVSFDDGEHWQSLQRNLPVSPVYDIIIHGDDLAVATHGRSFWVLDNITPLRQIGAETAHADFHLYQPAVAYCSLHSGYEGPATDHAGTNPPAGVAIDYRLNGASDKAVTLDIVDSKGGLVRRFGGPAGKDVKPKAGQTPMPAAAGLNRIYWNLAGKPLDTPDNGDDDWVAPSLLVEPGRYQVRLTVGTETQIQPLEVRMDPRVQVSVQEIDRAHEFRVKVSDQLTRAKRLVKQMRDVDTQLVALTTRIGAANQKTEFATAVSDLHKKTRDSIESVTGWKIEPKRYALNYPPALDDLLSMLSYNYAGSDSAPNQPAWDVLSELTRRLDMAAEHWQQIKATDLVALNAMAEKNHVPLVSDAPLVQTNEDGGESGDKHYENESREKD
jgi:photosystem II stability/assembly factor-like uncharacterized protein